MTAILAGKAASTKGEKTVFRPLPCAARSARRLVLVLAISCAGSGPAWGQTGLFDLGTLSTLADSTASAYGVSSDGTVVVGNASLGCCAYRVFRWTQGSGMLNLGTLGSTDQSYAGGVSADGAVVVGYARGLSAVPVYHAFRWTQAGGMVDLGGLPGSVSPSSAAYAVNADGSVVVGAATTDALGSYAGVIGYQAFRWTSTTGMVSLGALNAGRSSLAAAVSADGVVIVGQAADGAAGNALRAFRWTQASGMTGLGTLNGGGMSAATGVSGNGTLVVGRATDGAAGNALRAFRWTEATGMASLGTLNDGVSSEAHGVSANGNVIVGQAADGAAGNALRAFRWSQASGMQSVEAWLRSNGVGVAPGINTKAARAVDGTGSVVVGELENLRAFVARVSPNGSGMITGDFALSLAGAAPQALAANAGSLVLHGAHGNPLLGRAQPGRACAWAAGDWGRDRHDARDGWLGMAEIGACRSWDTGVQLSGSLGLTRSRQNLVHDGTSRLEGRFATLEAQAPLGPPGVWGTVTVLYHRGEADLRRGYLNAGMPDSSRGSTDARTWGIRVRADLEAAFRLGSATLSPYAALSQVETKAGAYAESGGGFPATFDERTERSSEARVGINATRPAGKLRLLGTLEAAHRFDPEGARSTGSIPGLFAFDVPGRKDKRDWLRAGAGVEGKLRGGTASVMLNVTTQGAAPAHWLAASYRAEF